ncbi:hypothetical protein TYRP_011840 [Tyrophagus putrescentiae]|nr:hypothetical protein TYRP_011840 [Tyrophagus putrescentiae]
MHCSAATSHFPSAVFSVVSGSQLSSKSPWALYMEETQCIEQSASQCKRSTNKGKEVGPARPM